MHIRELNGKRVCILGFGKEGQAMLKAIDRHSKPTKITIADKNPGPVGYRLPFHLYTCAYGPHYIESIPPSDIIIKSPGIPPTQEIRSIPGLHTSSTQIFFETIRDTGAMVIGITGTKGKSTTSSLIYHILQTAGKRAFLVGNIGKPAIEYIDEATPETIFVLEMSSYQLMDLTVSPHIAVITSFFPEHLDYHGSLDAYLEAKKHITRFQTQDDMVFFQATFPRVADIATEGEGRKIPFSAEDAPIALGETKLIGEHNRSNIGAATLVARELGIEDATINEALRSFQPLPHRLQSLGVHHGIEWIDDAISTTPESAIAALDALGDRVKTILLGGQDRGVDFTALGERIRNSSVRTVILFPGSGQRIREAIERAKAKVTFFDISTMQEAISIAKRETRIPSSGTSAPLSLLSPASPSYGMFKNFEEKGDKFRRCIEEDANDAEDAKD